MRVKFIECMVKKILVSLFRDKRCEWCSGVKRKKTYLLCIRLKKIAARLPFRKNLKFGLNQRFLAWDA